MSIGSRKSFKSTWKKNIFKIQRCSRNAKSRGKYGTGVGVGVKRDAANLGCKASRRHALANRPASSIPPSTHLHPPSILHPDPPSPPSTRLHPCHVPPQQLTRLAPASALNLSVAASLTPSRPFSSQPAATLPSPVTPLLSADCPADTELHWCLPVWRHTHLLRQKNTWSCLHYQQSDLQRGWK